MIPVRVGDEDMRHRLAAHGAQHGIDVVLEVGTGIDDAHLAMADDVGAGALEGEYAGAWALRVGRLDQPRLS